MIYFEGNYTPQELATLRLLQETLKAIFRKKFSLLCVDAVKIFEITTFTRRPRTTYSIQISSTQRIWYPGCQRVFLFCGEATVSGWKHENEKLCFTGKYNIRKIHMKPHLGDSSGIFSKSSLMKVTMTSLISSLSLKLYLNLLVYDRNIFVSSSNVFDNLQQSWKIFENFR